MITLHLYRDRNGRAVAKIDTPDGRVVLSDGDKAEALTLLTQAGESTAYQHPREAAEWRIVSRLGHLMRAKLAKRRGHGDWLRNGMWDAMNALGEEVEELRSAIRDYDVCVDHHTRREAIAEATDVAAYCAILIDVLVGDES